MNITVDQRDQSLVAVVEALDAPLSSAQDALDLMADIRYSHQCGKILLHQDQLAEDFFALRTGLAGDILQKYVTYGVKLAIVGEFGDVSSKALRDFIRESNKGPHIRFAASREEALDALHGMGID